MANDVPSGSRAADAIKLVSLGGLTLLLYAALFNYETSILEITGKGGWSFILPVSIAFVFSFFHGAFTGRFWDFLGVKAKK
ncbi:MAG: hypothetical protein ABT940_12370 [Alphaproteobacteria bacterium]